MLGPAQPCASALHAACRVLAAASAHLAVAGRGAFHTASPARRARAFAPGQPTSETHPQLLGQDELAPGIHAAEYAQRRAALARLMPAGGLAIVPAASMAFVTGVIPHPYRQDADFAWLTGVNQQAVALIRASSSGQPEFSLFIPAPDAEKERWDGATLGQAAAQQVFRADEVFSIAELPAHVQRLAAGATSVLYDFDRPSSYQAQSLRQSLHDAIGRGKTVPLKPHLHRLRWIKSPGEIALMRASAQVASASLARCMALSAPGVAESALATEFEYGVKLAGASRLAYPVVCGGGPDACTIHYSRNDKQVHGDQLVLMDAGCEFHGYASDVTRTWPVGGRFSAAQRRVYDLVAGVRRRCLEAAVPGNSLAKVHALSVQLLSEGLHALGILPGVSLEELTSRGIYRPFFCHSVGHYLGLDVHDTNTVGPHRTLEPGVVMAIEPGLYIPDAPQFGVYAGIGVRIEDDVLITPSGAQVLSGGVPVDAEQVEALVGSSAHELPSSVLAVLAAAPARPSGSSTGSGDLGSSAGSSLSDSEPAPAVAAA